METTLFVLKGHGVAMHELAGAGAPGIASTSEMLDGFRGSELFPPTGEDK
jgi:hypothetical protein